MCQLSSRLIFLIILLRCSCGFAQLPGATPSPVAAMYAFSVASFAADPVRPFVYAAEPTKDRVVVFKTNPLGFLKAIPVGHSPQNLAVSADGSRLFVANSGEKSISVIDLGTQTILAKWQLPYHPWDLEEGLDHRLYVTTGDYIRGDPAPPGINATYGVYHLMQIDSSTGTFQKAFGNTFGLNERALIEISNDRRTLFWKGLTFSGVVKVDVSTGTAGLFQFSALGPFPLKLSHSRQLLNCSKTFVDSANINGPTHTFATDLYPSAFAWSGDDLLAFVGGGHPYDSLHLLKPRIDIQSLRTLQTLSSIIVDTEPIDLIVDYSGKYLFAANPSTLNVYDISAKLDGYEPVLGAVQVSVLYQVHPNFDATSFSASHLPLGLQINATTGLISGVPLAMGDFTATVTASRGMVQATRSLFFKIYAASLRNISTRAFGNPGENLLIGGFIIEGSQPKKVGIRALGPSLATYHVPGLMGDPSLYLYDSAQNVVTANDDWESPFSESGEEARARLQAAGLVPQNSKEAAVIVTLDPGAYTVVVTQGFWNPGAGGVALMEIYDLDESGASRLANISSRAFVAYDTLVAIAGFIVRGSDAGTIVIRAIGPSLAASGIAHPLADPTLELHDGQGVLIAANDNWKDSQRSEIQLTGLAPSNDHESAIVGHLRPGNYTAVLRGVNGSTGVCLVEAYNVR